MRSLNEIEFNNVLESNRMALINFYDGKTDSSEKQLSVINQIIDENNGEVAIATVNTVKTPQIAQRYSVSKCPSMILFKDGVEVRRVSGCKTKNEILSFMG